MSHQKLIITKHGKPAAKLVPINEPNFVLFGAMANSVDYLDDDWIQPINK